MAVKPLRVGHAWIKKLDEGISLVGYILVAGLSSKGARRRLYKVKISPNKHKRAQSEPDYIVWDMFPARKFGLINKEKG